MKKLRKLLATTLTAAMVMTSFAWMGSTKVEAAASSYYVEEDMPLGFDLSIGNPNIAFDADLTTAFMVRNNVSIVKIDLATKAEEVLYTGAIQVLNIEYSDALDAVFFSDVLETKYKQRHLKKVNVSDKSVEDVDTETNYTAISVPSVSADGKYILYGRNPYNSYGIDLGEYILVDTEAGTKVKNANYSGGGYHYKSGITDMNYSTVDKAAGKTGFLIPNQEKYLYNAIHSSMGIFSADYSEDPLKIKMEVTPSSASGVHQYMVTVGEYARLQGSAKNNYRAIRNSNNTDAKPGSVFVALNGGSGEWAIEYDYSNGRKYSLVNLVDTTKSYVLYEGNNSNGWVLSDDGKKAISRFNYGKMRTYDLSSLVEGTATITAPTLLNSTLKKDKLYVELEGDPLAKEYQYFVNGKRLLTSKVWNTYLDIPLEGPTNVEIYSVSANGTKSDPLLVPVDVPVGKKFTVGGQQFVEGSLFIFSGKEWKVVGDNKLMTSLPTLQPYLKDMKKEVTDFFNTLTTAEKDLLESTTWKVSSLEDDSMASVELGPVGLLTYEEHKGLSFFTNSSGPESLIGQRIWLYSVKSRSESKENAYLETNGDVLTASSDYSRYYAKPVINLKPSLMMIGSGIKGDEVIILGLGTSKPQVPAITNLKGESTSSNEVKLTWDAAGVTGYQVKRDGQVIGDVIVTTFTDTTATAGASHKYEVAAKNGAEIGAFSSITVKVKDAALEAPKNFAGVALSKTEAKLTWNSVTGADGYILERDGQELPGTISSPFTDSNLTPGQEYTYTLKAKRGQEVSPSISVKVTTEKDKLPQPANFVATEVKDKSLKLSWEAVAGADKYTVRDKQSSRIVHLGPETEVTVTGLLPDTVYTFELFASNSTQESDPVLVNIKTSVGLLPYPTNLQVVKLSHDEVGLMWDAMDADQYQIMRDGQVIDMVTSTYVSDTTVQENTEYLYSVSAIKNGVVGQPALKLVKTPTIPVVGQAPDMPVGLKVTRAYADKVKLQWPTVTGATYYDLYRDGAVLVYSGSLTAFTDDTTGPEETYTYMVVAGNDYGRTAGAPVSVTTPAEAPQIIISPSAPAEGTITFKFNVIEGAYEYHVERNPHWTYTSNGDGSYRLSYENTATGEVRDYGNVTPEDGKLPFYEDNVNPGQNYHYEVTAVRMGANGTPEVIGGGEVNIDAPTDGGGATVPDPSNPGGGSTDPGNGGGTTDPGNGGGSTDPGNGGGTTNPPVDNGGGTTTPGGNGGGNTTPSGGGATTPPTSGGGSTTTPPSSGGNTTKPPVVEGTVTPPTDGDDKTETHAEEGKDTAAGNEFSDVKEEHFASEAIKELTSKGILKGYANGTFGPDRSVTRAEFAIMLTRAMGLQDSANYEGKFKDLDSDAWYAEELSKALYNGITKGFTDNTYRPNVYIPREQAAIMVSNILRKEGLTASTKDVPFKDKSEIVSWAVSDVAFATEYEIIKGYSNGTFKPKAEITRAEVAVIIQRLLNL